MNWSWATCRKGHMATTDNPLKRLVTLAADDVAAWLLERPVREVTTRPSNLVPPATALDSDLVFFVTLEDGREEILHLEFQGPRSKRPMPIRMLEYQTRLAATYPNMPLTSVVWYVGGAGAGDTGTHQHPSGQGQGSLTWYYHVIRLWELDGEALLALHRPALAALIGQTRLRNPQPALRQAVDQIVTGTHGERQTLLLIEFLTLCTDKEVAAMAEQIVQYDDYGMEESPFMLKWMAKGHEKGREEERQTLLLRLLTRRYGPLSSDMTTQINALSATQMLDLAEALLDFTSHAALEQWLAAQAQRGAGEEA
jgi:predicted transposase YdaD